MDYGLADQFKIHLKDDVLELRLPDLCKTDEKWFVSKFRVVADLRELTDVHVMRFLEEYEKKVEAPKEGVPAETKAEEAKAEAKPRAAPKKARQPKKPAEHVKSEEELPSEEKAPEEL
jgi:pyruvate-formate lyase-activating enzyme